MLKSELLRAIQQEIHKHDFSHFVDNPPSVAQGGKGVVVPGCPMCKKRINTMSQFLDHLAEDAMPALIEKLSTESKGLDFHHYCHAITHWNLPSNPVDLEQREGRIHRYKGHAVRKNVAAAFAAEALHHGHSDAWETAFELGRTGRSVNDNDLVPYWLFPGDAKIERQVPALPFSREVERLYGLRRALAIYRMVFGQSRQEDLITYLLAQIPENKRDGIVAELQIDLSPS